MVQLMGLVGGVAGEVETQTAEGVIVHRGKNDRGMGLASLEAGQHGQGERRVFVGGGGNGKGDQHFV